MTELLAPAPDILGSDFTRQSFAVRDAFDPQAVGTLVRYPLGRRARGAVLWVHGFSDYFFHRHVAQWYAERDIELFAVDLRRYGRSLLPGQAPHFVASLEDYYQELDKSLDIIRTEYGHDHVLGWGHSTGGLILANYAHDRRTLGRLQGLVLNSPWFDVAGAPWLLQAATAAVHELARLAPLAALHLPSVAVYGPSLHSAYHGEWDYSLAWKPFQSAPIRAGWLSAVRRGQHKLHAGMDVDVPVLVLRSAKSGRFLTYSEQVHEVDVILDVDTMSQWAPKLGRDVVVEVLDGAVHDVTLSRESVREDMFNAVDAWWCDRFDVSRDRVVI